MPRSNHLIDEFAIKKAKDCKNNLPMENMQMFHCVSHVKELHKCNQMKAHFLQLHSAVVRMHIQSVIASRHHQQNTQMLSTKPKCNKKTKHRSAVDREAMAYRLTGKASEQESAIAAFCNCTTRLFAGIFPYKIAIISQSYTRRASCYPFRAEMLPPGVAAFGQME